MGALRPRSFGKNAVELLKLNPDAVLAATSAVVTAVKKETTTIPVVFFVVSDPEGQGFVTTVAHPEGNITGFHCSRIFIRSQVVTVAERVRTGPGVRNTRVRSSAQ